MKITHINAGRDQFGEVPGTTVGLTIAMGDMDPVNAARLVMNIFSYAPAHDMLPTGNPASDAQIITETVDMPEPTTTLEESQARRTRHRRTRAEMQADEEAKARAALATIAGASPETLVAAVTSPNAPAYQSASEPVAPTSTSTEVTSRRRRVEAPAPDPMPITDSELSKAASNAAEELVKLGDDGPGIVTLVLKDFSVASVNELVGPAREKFIHAVNEEVRLAKEAYAAGQQG